MTHTVGPKLTVEDHRELANNLGVEEAADDQVTFQQLSGAVKAETDPSFASMGEAIRGDLSGRLDADLLETERANIAAQLGRLEEVREVGVPDGPDGPYSEVAEPVRRVYDHLVEVGFFESLEENLPRFTADHIAQTARELILADPLTTGLDEVGFDEREKVALLMNVVNNNDRLARWVPTAEIPAERVEFDVSNVPPLHQRAVGGGLLWIENLDKHLWHQEVLITDRILDDAAWNVKALLGGLYVVTTAALDVATGDTLSDGQLTAALTAGAAISIISQEDLMRDAHYITDEMRAPFEED